MVVAPFAASTRVAPEIKLMSCQSMQNVPSAAFHQLDSARLAQSFDLAVAVPAVTMWLVAQAMHGRGSIQLRTRIARQVTIARHRWRLALDLHVIDNGPGVPEEIAERIFFPLVSGRDGGSGLGLTLAQTFVQQHGGLIECESKPGRTDFRILLPLP